jgi:hypothetical protein
MIYRGPGFLASYGSSPLSREQVVSFSVSLCEAGDEGMGGGRGRSKIIRRRESLVVYKSFNTLWYIESAAALPPATEKTIDLCMNKQ